ncbi:hypothetical protein TURU_161592 [Turdus rufiventris]|nr:hypothetical protein TURU_161592 [Turdus rufiventris]
MDDPEEEECSCVFTGRAGASFLSRNPWEVYFWLVVQGCHIDDDDDDDDDDDGDFSIHNTIKGTTST